MYIKTGGPAFPRPSVEFKNGYIEQEESGMTLRDWFAGQAISARLKIAEDYNDSCRANGTDSRLAFSDVAESCYELADAMLAERERGMK